MSDAESAVSGRDSLVIDDARYVAEFALVVVRVRLELPYPSLNGSPNSSFRSDSPYTNVRHLQPVVFRHDEGYKTVFGDIRKEVWSRKVPQGGHEQGRSSQNRRR